MSYVAVAFWVFLAITLAMFAFVGAFYWLTRDTGNHSAGPRRPFLVWAWLTSWLVYLEPDHRPRPLTWARAAIARRIARTAAIPPAGNADPDRVRHAHLRALRQLDGGRPWEYETGEWPKIMLDGRDA